MNRIRLVLLLCFFMASGIMYAQKTTEQKMEVNMLKENNFMKNDPEFAERFDRFAFGEVYDQTKTQIDDRVRYMCYMATLLGCQGVDVYKPLLQDALDKGVTPIEVKEIIYQATAYLGLGRVYPFLTVANHVFKKRGIELPLEPQSQTIISNRRKKGNQVQIDIFGERIRESWKNAPEDSRHINEWLADNCFGDYYTRKGLTIKQREMITFCYIAAQGGCESQLKAHIMGNFSVGNDKDFLIAVISNNIPFIGYPRALNALNCIREVVKQTESSEASLNISKYNITKEQLVFPFGQPNTAYAKYFIGHSYLASIASGEGKLPVHNVTFEPGCRNNWHIHKGGGQILICVAGRGWYQEWGKPVQELKPGDTIDIPAGVKHWHGAAKDSWFQHIALAVPAENSSTDWLEAVSDEEYGKLK
ncbi:carboxymuconolactone decarboxylase family protein [Phocaeicola oris]|uniref:carboxymuconolactone decarboxylase family protein n=1 Tax=Phocaeicola oris TaxID=2896850 RepID=UPI00234E7EF6|nr:carboxymuconolactone decarboxylase family protein [Phocaeicola oris]MCE2615540.1 carboxymuconolactone decarboxylase family protein [Phocaeicola oris]